MNRRPFRPAAWFALLALLLQVTAVFAPGLRAAPGTAAEAMLHQVCTAAGLQVLAATDNGSAPAAPADGAGRHCPFCASQAAVMAVAPVAPGAAPTPVLTVARPADADPPAPPLTSHPGAPRAPPHAVPA